jgi:4-carboxymuconolactone decarboxylase
MPNRLSILRREQLPADQRRFHDALGFVRRRSITGPFITLLNSSPDLAARFAHLGHYFHARGQADESILPARVRTFIALILSRALDGPYEWSAWVGWAVEAGIPQAAADAIRERRKPEGLTEEDTLVLDFCTQLLTGEHRVSDATYQKALDHFGAQGLVELVCTLGYFAMIAFPLNAFEIEMSAEQKAMRKPFEPLRYDPHPRPGPDLGASSQSGQALTGGPGPLLRNHFKSGPGPGRGARAIPRFATHGDLAPQNQHFLDRIVMTRGRISPPYQVLLNTPDVAARVAHVGNFVLYETILPPAVKTLTWLIAAAEYDCAYEWTAFVGHARKAGVPEAVIESVMKGEKPAEASREQAILIDFCHQLLRGNHHVIDTSYQATVEHFGVAATVQIAALIGYFVMWAFLLNAFEIEPQEESEYPL